VQIMRIGDAARLAGVGVETVRFYERKGLIPQPGKPQHGGYRHYPGDTIQAIRFIRQAQELGFSLKEIGGLLEIRDDPDGDCMDVQTRARQKLTEVEYKIGQLQKIGDALRGIITSCPSRGGLEGCTIMAALGNPTDPSSAEVRPTLVPPTGAVQ
jgi:MerR family transcriptional regulator, copper efflux regulator